MKAKNKELFDKIKRNINPVDNTLSNHLGSLPIGVINELCDEKFADLSIPTLNTIKKLIDEDLERWSPFELPISQIPKYFWILDKIGNQVGPNIGDVLDQLKEIKLLPEKINDPELMHELKIKGINKEEPISCRQMKPSTLLKLNDKGLISLDRDSKNLIQSTMDTGINYFKPLNNIPNSQQKSISEFDKDLISKLPSDINFNSLKQELESIKIPKSTLSNKNPSILSKVLNKQKINPNVTEIKASQLLPSQILDLEEQKLIQLSPEAISELSKIKDITQPKGSTKVNFEKLIDFIKSAHQSFKDLINKFNRRPIKGNGWTSNHIDIESDVDYQKWKKEFDKKLMGQTLPADILDSILSPEIRPMLIALADKNNNVVLSDLPFSIQNELSKEGIVIMPKVEKLSEEEKEIFIPKDEVCKFSSNITPNEIDNINPGFNKVKLQDLCPAVFKDLLDNGVIDKYRTIGGIESMKDWLEVIPEEIGTNFIFNCL